jgi:CDP-Glycerol:Poly(glycerophosphate) glycerophosphotransferase
VTQRPVWVVVADPLTARVFFDCGIVDRLAERLDGRLTLAFSFPRAASEEWAARVPAGVRVLLEDDLYPVDVAPLERIRRRVDRWLDERIGYYPLAIRLNLRHGFHRERMHPGHRNHLLDSDRVGPFPVRHRIDRAMRHWHFSPRRYVASALRRRLEAERPAVVLSNLQMQSATPFIGLGRRLGLTTVGYVASWDHTVGKGVIWNELDGYVVQNEAMADDLVRYHDVPRELVAVTGWPQADVFYAERPRAAFDELLRGYGLDPARPVVTVMGNTPTNMPYEGVFFRRLVAWWESSGASRRFSLLFRPHPRDREWRERFAAAVDRPGAAVQEPSFTDIDVLATILQHTDAVVVNAGTVLLDALVNDRPAVCVLYDEGAQPGESWAEKSVIGEHYRDVASSGAFHEARSFDEVTAGIARCLDAPGELAAERRAVTARVVGPVDGKSAERVVEAILEGIGDAAA